MGTWIEKDGYKWNIRVPEGYQDLKVITEVVAEDSYGLNDMHSSGFRPETIVDIGGHIGSFGVFAKRLWPKAKLIAVEPDVQNYELYKKNIKDNAKDIIWDNGKAASCPSTTVINAAISYDETRDYIVKSPRTSGGWFLRNKEEAQLCVDGTTVRCTGIQEVKTTTLEEVTKGIDRIDILKMDCEGGEWDILLNFTQPERVLFVMGEAHVRRSFGNVPYREWNDNVFWRTQIWRTVKRRWPHLDWNYNYKRLCLFQAGPKVA